MATSYSAARHQLTKAAGKKTPTRRPKNTFKTRQLQKTEKSSTDVVIVQADPLDDDDAALSALNVNKQYALTNGYVYSATHGEHTDPLKLHRSYEKIAALLNVASTAKYALWLDPYAAVRLHDLKIEPIVDFMLEKSGGNGDIALCCLGGTGEPRTDVMIVRKSEWTARFLGDWTLPTPGQAMKPDTTRLRALMKADQHKCVSEKHIVLFHETAFNSIRGSVKADTFVWNAAEETQASRELLLANLLADVTTTTTHAYSIKQAALLQYATRGMGRGAMPHTLLIIAYDDTQQAYATISDALVRITCLDNPGLEAMSVHADPAAAMLILEALDAAHGSKYTYMGVVSPGATFVHKIVNLELRPGVASARVPGLFLTRAGLATPLNEREVSDGTQQLPEMSVTTHTSGVRRRLGAVLSLANAHKNGGKLETIQLPPDFFSTYSETLEERVVQARVWLAVAISGLLVVFISGMVLRYGPVVHYKGEDKNLNRGGKDRIRW
jgi:hypothetical protein